MKIKILGCGGSFGSPLAWNKNGKISVLETYQYLNSNVPAYTRDNFRRDQNPVLEVRTLSKEIILARKK